MINNYSESRQRAESAFGKVRTEHLRRSRLLSEQETIDQARDAKSARLKQLRLDRDANDLLAAKAKKPSSK